MKQIPLSKKGKNAGKYFSIVDDEDYEYINQFNWSVKIEKNSNGKYAQSRGVVKGKLYSLHRILLNITNKNIIIDHIDGNGLNNQKNNLRVATKAENNRNRRSSKNGKSKYLGVNPCKRKWENSKEFFHAGIRVNGKSIFLGSFKTEIEAAIAYDNSAKIYNKEFANLNFK